MGRILTITNSRNINRGVRKSTVKKELVIGPTTIKFLTIGIFAVLALVYLAQSTAGANRSMEVQQYTDKKSQLVTEKERLEVEKYRLESLGEIDAGVDKSQMEPVTQVVKP